MRRHPRFSPSLARALALVMLASSTSACIEFPRYQPQPLQRPNTLESCFGMYLYQPNDAEDEAIIDGRQKVCTALRDPKLDEVFAQAFDGALAARPTSRTGALEMVEGPRVLEALRKQSATWNVHVFVVPRAHELARTDYGMRAISLTPRRLEGTRLVDTLAHELMHLVEAPLAIDGDAQWFKDGGHRTSSVKSNQYASYFVGHALACLVDRPTATVEQLVECAETQSF